MDFQKYLEQLKDPYERKARLFPGLLVVAPIVIALANQFGLKHPMLASVSGVLISFGAMYGLASLVRGRGKKLEDKLVASWGGMPTTVILRHRDNFLDGVTKRRYHDLITRKLGIPMPAPDQERTDPLQADDSYRGATRRLRELTRSDRGLLFYENIAYGFHRNMLAMKSIGIGLCLVAILYGLIQANALKPDAPFFELGALTTAGVNSGVTLVVSITFMLVWIFHFDGEAVRRIGYVYAERLLEHLPSLNGEPPRHTNQTRVN